MNDRYASWRQWNRGLTKTVFTQSAASSVMIKTESLNKPSAFIGN